MRPGAQLRRDVAIVQRYLTSLRSSTHERSGRFTRRPAAPAATTPAGGDPAKAAPTRAS